VIGSIVSALISGLLGFIGDYLKDLRRERDLKDLGYTQAERDAANEGLKRAERANEIRAGNLVPGAAERLRTSQWNRDSKRPADRVGV